MMLDGLRMQTRPGGETTDVMVTVPVNPLTGATVMVELAGEPVEPFGQIVAEFLEGLGKPAKLRWIDNGLRHALGPATKTIKGPGAGPSWPQTPGRIQRRTASLRT